MAKLSGALIRKHHGNLKAAWAEKRRGSRSRSSRPSKPSHRPRGSRGSSMSSPRSAPRGKSYGLVEGGGVAAIGVALTSNAVGAVSPVRSAWGVLKGDQTLRDVAYNLKQSTPILGSDSAHADTRKWVAGGAIAAVGGPLLRKIPLIRKIARLSYRVDKKVRIRVA